MVSKHWPLLSMATRWAVFNCSFSIIDLPGKVRQMRLAISNVMHMKTIKRNIWRRKREKQFVSYLTEATKTHKKMYHPRRPAKLERSNTDASLYKQTSNKKPIHKTCSTPTEFAAVVTTVKLNIWIQNDWSSLLCYTKNHLYFCTTCN